MKGSSNTQLRPVLRAGLALVGPVGLPLRLRRHAQGQGEEYQGRPLHVVLPAVVIPVESIGRQPARAIDADQCLIIRHSMIASGFLVTGLCSVSGFAQPSWTRTTNFRGRCASHRDVCRPHRCLSPRYPGPTPDSPSFRLASSRQPGCVNLFMLRAVVDSRERAGGAEHCHCLHS